MNTTAVITTPSGPTNPTMKLLIDTASHRVLFAEAGKDVVDFLFGILAMPVGAMASMLLADGDDGAMGAVGNLYASVEKMDNAFLQDTNVRDALVVNTSLPSGPSLRLVPNNCNCNSCNSIPAADDNRPGYILYPPVPPGHAYPPMPPGYEYPPMAMAPPPPQSISLLPVPPGYAYPPMPPGYEYPPMAMAPPPPPPQSISLLPPGTLSDNAGNGLPPPQLYRCHACHALGALQGYRGFVQGVATYTVMDDLAVAPMTNIASIALLNKLGVKDIDALEERTVSIGRKECLEILKVSLRSKAVLTDVFLPSNKRARTDKE